MDLYGRLSYLFGDEEHMNMRRGLVLLREEIQNYQLFDEQFICSGSLGEGVAYPTSDDDFMKYPTFTRVVKSYREATQRLDLLMYPSEYSPGYCLLLDVNHSYPINMIHVIGGMPFLSSTLWKVDFLREGETIHGPCRSGVLGYYEYDFACCIPCSAWPDIANDWISRNRLNDWPSNETIHSITVNGCHVVPIGDQISSYHQHEWRISFSIAERTLMHSLNHVKFLTYNLLRLCLKRVIEKGSPGVLCSYFLKTTLFYTAENTSTHFWEAGNIETCFKTCLSVLYDYVDHGYCPNYFIPEYNMIKRKVNHNNRQPLLDMIRSLHGIGIVATLHLCGEAVCLEERISYPIKEQKLDFEFLNSDLFHLIVRNLSFIISKLEINEVLFKLFRLLQRYSGWKMTNIIFRRGIICCCQKLINRQLSPLRMNKRNYRLHKTMDALCGIGYRVDVTTGKLTAATYMYLNGKTESALSHIRRLLSEFPPYAIDDTMSFNYDMKRLYMDVMCGRRYTMEKKMRQAFAPQYTLFKDFPNAFPFSLRIWTSTYTFRCISLDSLSYTYFLESLCYIRLQNRTLAMKSTKCLVNRLDDMTDYGDMIFTRICVGIIKYAQGDSQSACRWFGSAYLMKDVLPLIFTTSLSKPVMVYIACLLNRNFQTEDYNSQNAY